MKAKETLEFSSGMITISQVPDDVRFDNSSSYLSGNKLINGIQLRQVRVESLACARTAIDIVYNVTQCYNSLTLDNVETSWVSSNGMKLSNIPASIQSAYVFQTADQTNDILTAGNYGLYPGKPGRSRRSPHNAETSIGPQTLRARSLSKNTLMRILASDNPRRRASSQASPTAPPSPRSGAPAEAAGPRRIAVSLHFRKGPNRRGAPAPAHALGPRGAARGHGTLQGV